MPYRRILKELVESTPRAVGAILLDWEGEAVQEYCSCEPYEIRFVAAHQGILLGRLREIHAAAGAGEIEELVVSTSGGRMVIGCINQDYSLMLQVGPGCPLGLALHRFSDTITMLRKEI